MRNFCGTPSRRVARFRAWVTAKVVCTKFRTPAGNKSWPRPCTGGGKLRSPSGTTCSVAIVDVVAAANFSGADRQHVSSRPEINTSRGASRDSTQHTSTRLRPTEIDSRPRTGCKPIIRPIMCKYTVRRPYSVKAQTTLVRFIVDLTRICCIACFTTNSQQIVDKCT